MPNIPTKRSSFTLRLQHWDSRHADYQKQSAMAMPAIFELDLPSLRPVGSGLRAGDGTGSRACDVLDRISNFDKISSS